MEESGEQQERDPITSSDAGQRPVGPDDLTEQPFLPNKERIVSTNPSPDAATIGTSRDVTDQVESSDTGGDLGTSYPLNSYTSHEQTFYLGGYDNSSGGYAHYVNVDGLQVVPPMMYNDNSSLLFHTGYGFNPELAYGQYSPVASPLPSVLVDGQLYSSHQLPLSPSYYPQPVGPSVQHVHSTVSVSHNELLTQNSNGQEGVSDNMLYGPGPGYLVPFGTFGRGDLSRNSGLPNIRGEFALGKLSSNGLNPQDAVRHLSPLASPATYPQPIGILGSYDHNVGQRPMHGFGLVSNSSVLRHHHGRSYQSSNFGSASVSRFGGNNRNHPSLDKGRRRERDRDSICISNDSYDIFNDRNRGPRASKPKGQSTDEGGTLSSMRKNSGSTSGVPLDLYNQVDFVTDYENAKFFIIKSFSEDNVHKSIKYKVWASTPLGNRKLDAAYHEAKEIQGNCPVFLLFSVNASAQFCGVAEMVGPVDFEKNADYWQQDRWSGQFSVQWHIIKDVPNSRFRHIILENNENKPVTHSRDTQEVKLEEGIEMLRIFKNYEARTSILDDFDFYNDRERALQERKAKQKVTQKTGAPAPPPGSSSLTTDATISHANDSSSIIKDEPTSIDCSIEQVADNFAEALKLEKINKESTAPERHDEHQT